MIGQTISHYRILDKLGEGGMGVVYQAESPSSDVMVRSHSTDRKRGSRSGSFIRMCR